MSTFVDGVGASQNIDTAGEVIDIMGMDISSLALNGVANFEHESKLPDQIVGKVLKAKKIFSEKDCDNDREVYFWSKTGIAFVYVLIELFDDYKDSAKEVAGMFRYDADKKGQNEKNVMNFSIEGAKLEKQGNIIVKSIARKVTITVLPANHMAIAEMVPADNKKGKDDIDSLFKSQTSVEIELIKTEDVGQFLAKMSKSANSGMPPKPPENKGAHIGNTTSGKEVFSHEKIHNYQGFSGQDHKDAAALHHDKMGTSKDAKLAQHHLGKRNLHLQAAGSSEKRETRLDRAGSTVKSGIGSAGKIKTSVLRPYIEVKDKPTAPIKKALTAGSGMGSPGTLTGGAALAKQCVDPKMHKGCTHEPNLTKSEEVFEMAKSQYEQWENKEQFVKFMSSRMPKMTKSEIDVFGATMLLKKSMDSENALEDLMKSEKTSKHEPKLGNTTPHASHEEMMKMPKREHSRLAEAHKTIARSDENHPAAHAHLMSGRMHDSYARATSTKAVVPGVHGSGTQWAKDNNESRAKSLHNELSASN